LTIQGDYKAWETSFMPKKTSKMVYHQPKRRFFPGFAFFAGLAFLDALGFAFLAAFFAGFLDFATAFLTGALATFGAGFVGASGSKTSPQSRQITWSRIVLCTMFCEAQSGHSLMLRISSLFPMNAGLLQEV
jgi:hypothetical protein